MITLLKLKPEGTRDSGQDPSLGYIILHGQIDFVQDVPKKRPSMQEEDAGVGAEVEEVAGVAPTGAGGDVAGGTPRKTGGRLSRSKNRNITEVKSSEVVGSTLLLDLIRCWARHLPLFVGFY